MISAYVTINARTTAASASPRRESHVHIVIVAAHERLRWLRSLYPISGNTTVTTHIVIALSPSTAEIRLMIGEIHFFTTNVTSCSWTITDIEIVRTAISIFPNHSHLVPAIASQGLTRLGGQILGIISFISRCYDSLRRWIFTFFFFSSIFDSFFLGLFFFFLRFRLCYSFDFSQLIFRVTRDFGLFFQWNFGFL